VYSVFRVCPLKDAIQNPKSCFQCVECF